MQKMINLIVAVFSLNAAMACEPYFSVGSGPGLLIPNVSLGARFDDPGGKMDLSLTHAQSELYTVTRLTAAKLVYGPLGVYVGPSYSLSFHRMKYLGIGNECLIGIIAGKDFGDCFLQFEVNKKIYHRNFCIDTYQSTIKFGVKF